jgi:low temperature requirement protein LtrA
MGRTAYHLIHPIMVAGIIVVAAGDEVVLSEPGAPAAGSTAWLALGGPALFIAGHAAFKMAVWRVVSWPRVAAVVILGLLGLAAGSLSGLGLAVCAAAVVVGVAVADHWSHR